MVGLPRSIGCAVAWENGDGSRAAAEDLDTVVAGLDRLPLAEFVAARDRLSAGCGPPATHRPLPALQGPTVSVWAANQFACRCRPTSWRAVGHRHSRRRAGVAATVQESVDRWDHMIGESC